MNYTRLNFNRLITYYLIDAKISILVGLITVIIITYVIGRIL